MVARVRPSLDPFQCGPGDLLGDGPDHGPSPRVSQHLRRLRDIDPSSFGLVRGDAPFWLNGATQESNLPTSGYDAALVLKTASYSPSSRLTVGVCVISPCGARQCLRQWRQSLAT